MSVTSAKEFLEKIKSDEDFRKTLENPSSDDVRKQIVEEQGFDFTKAELKEAGGGASDWVSATGTAAGAARDVRCCRIWWSSESRRVLLKSRENCPFCGWREKEKEKENP